MSISGCPGCMEILPLPCIPSTKGKLLLSQADFALFFFAFFFFSVNCLSNSWAPLGPKLGCPCCIGLQWGSLLWFFLSFHSHPWLTLSLLCTHILLQLGLTTSLLRASFVSLSLHPALYFHSWVSFLPSITPPLYLFPHKLQAWALYVSGPGLIPLSSSWDSPIQEC